MTKSTTIGPITAHDDDLIPVEEMQRTIRKFGDQYNFTAASVLSRALEIPNGTINTILYGKKDFVSGETKRKIEYAIRHFNPRTSPETLVDGVKFAKVVHSWMKRHGIESVTAAAEILGMSARTLRGWVNGYETPKHLRAGDITPTLLKMEAYTKEQALAATKLDKYNYETHRRYIDQ